jgi:hypothetical protein
MVLDDVSPSVRRRQPRRPTGRPPSGRHADRGPWRQHNGFVKVAYHGRDRHNIERRTDCFCQQETYVAYLERIRIVIHSYAQRVAGRGARARLHLSCDFGLTDAQSLRQESSFECRRLIR